MFNAWDYWEILTYNERVALLKRYGGFSSKHAKQEYRDLTPALQKLVELASKAPGGIIPLDSLHGVLADEYIVEETNKLVKQIRGLEKKINSIHDAALAEIPRGQYLPQGDEIALYMERAEVLRKLGRYLRAYEYK